MNKDLSNYRKTYQKGELLETAVPEAPIELFQQWFYEVEEAKTSLETNAMNIASIGLDGFPKSRIVLLKRFTWEGFIFYTNYNSEKGKAIANNPNICASFFWEQQEKQVIIKGKAEKIQPNLSDGYFETRPEGSKLGAWASNQSEVVSSKEQLNQQLENYTQKFKDKEIPRPEHWGGYIIKPISIEFWQGRPNRMHDRIRYTLLENFEWKIERLAP
ncbi:pyridoxamine 5'-phosphate oxidase [Wenyingzhuangia heitensis]|uniref:Pyridoxine/pyridoxamine 5'-phosphate oxidase n=1 Tax=Wenyingzhuangia heitensis TaxID=1487859 RepID=A0ABX0U901_9FLAO|nr:pyridoxamine 5'-phosphate oxidase [Wenyingzhuangia heitensis]NIJ45314.1 pyridoxamine 5'-phosphate oxidase [Wenyingzhuangia heitensis]